MELTFYKIRLSHFSEDMPILQYIHSSSGAGGAGAGHADWYPNGGANQPGCNDFGCRHGRSVDYYVESLISNKFVGKPCDTYENFKAGKCKEKPSVVMGTLALDTKYI